MNSIVLAVSSEGGYKVSGSIMASMTKTPLMNMQTMLRGRGNKLARHVHTLSKGTTLHMHTAVYLLVSVDGLLCSPAGV